MVEVYHRKDSRFGLGPKGQFPQDYVLVAKVETDDLEVAFERTNTIDGYWWENEGVEALVSKTRSTSVGDVMVKDGAAWVAMGCGFARWSEISSEEAYGYDERANLVVGGER